MCQEGIWKCKEKNKTKQKRKHNDNVGFSSCAVLKQALLPIWEQRVSEAFTILFHVPHLQALLHQQDSLAVVTPPPPLSFFCSLRCANYSPPYFKALPITTRQLTSDESDEC